MTERSALARAILALDREERGKGAPFNLEPLQAMAALGLELGTALGGDLRRFAELSVELGDSRLVECLLDLPMRVAQAGQSESALALARAFEFLAPDKLRGDSALFLAQAGRREDAEARIRENLERAEDSALAEAKAGDAYRALGEHDAAEAYYRRSLSEAKTPFERSEAVLRIVSLLSDTGREPDALRFLAEERAKKA